MVAGKNEISQVQVKSIPQIRKNTTEGFLAELNFCNFWVSVVQSNNLIKQIFIFVFFSTVPSIISTVIKT